MVAQIEHTRKPGRSVARLVPETVLVLQLYEVVLCPRCTTGCSIWPAAMRPSKAQAVWEAVLGARS